MRLIMLLSILYPLINSSSIVIIPHNYKNSKVFVLLCLSLLLLLSFSKCANSHYHHRHHNDVKNTLFRRLTFTSSVQQHCWGGNQKRNVIPIININDNDESNKLLLEYYSNVLLLSSRGGGGGGGVDGTSDLEKEEEEYFDDDNDGSNTDNTDNDNNNINIDDDNERYSRQVYTLGTIAHQRLRSSTIYIDGLYKSSGLLYEICKNLVLSGVKHIIIVNNDNNENNKEIENISQQLDDLGNIYRNGAQEELLLLNSKNDNNEIISSSSDQELLIHYLQRLNPNIIISSINRNQLLHNNNNINNEDTTTIPEYNNDNDNASTNNVVYLCIDQSYEHQIYCNEYISRYKHWKFISVETYGIYGRIFCDFGNNNNNNLFEVYDSDGEVLNNIPLDKVEYYDSKNNNHNMNNKKKTKTIRHEDEESKEKEKEGKLVKDGKNIDEEEMIVYCIDGEKHDVSKGDYIEFQYTKLNHNQNQNHHRFVVTEVMTPYRIRIKLVLNTNKEEEENRTNNLEELAVTNVIEHINQYATSFKRIKTSQYISFYKLKDSIDMIQNHQNSNSNLFTLCDLEKGYDTIRQNTCMGCFQTLSQYIKQYNHYPTISNYNEFYYIMKDTWKNMILDNDNNDNDISSRQQQQQKQHIHNFLHCCAAKFTPIQAMFGAIAAQEAIKAVTGLYYPIKQFLLYDCDEILKKVKKLNDNNKASQICNNNHFDDTTNKKKALGLRYILGDKIVNRLQKKNIFLVGAGAIGCEILKNLASMGIGTNNNNGKIIITDMDTIEKSNLSRQLLFRDTDIGKFKSSAARDSCLRFEPNMKIEVHSSKVGLTTSSSSSDDLDDENISNDTPFNDEFWSNHVDIVLNALDNVEARLYIDQKCVENKLALIDAGTMGPKGNVQVIIPNQSESYSSSIDPPEPSIPVCTLKDFPYMISHTIQWARTLFDQLYEKRPDQVNDFLKSRIVYDVETLTNQFIQEKGDESAMEIAKEIHDDVMFWNTIIDQDITQIRTEALRWAINLSYNLFYNAPMELLRRHPIDSVDDDGGQFWSGTRRPPNSLMYMIFPAENDSEQQTMINENLINFVMNAARLKLQTILGDKYSPDMTVFSKSDVEQAYGSFEPTSSHHNTITASVSSRVLSLIDVMIPTTTNNQLSAIEFEKDDESNGHVAFVAAASNLRAMIYGIPPVDVLETRRIAGKIIPAMITTTALVSALSCLELLKVVQRTSLNAHRNSFVNLALPFFAFTVPLPAEINMGLHGKQYTLWDRLVIRESEKHANVGGISLSKLLRRFRKLASDDPENVSVASVSYGQYMLYADFLHEDNLIMLRTPLWQLVDEAMKESQVLETTFSRTKSTTVTSNKPLRYLDLTVVVSDALTGDEVELPTIRVQRYP